MEKKKIRQIYDGDVTVARQQVGQPEIETLGTRRKKKKRKKKKIKLPSTNRIFLYY